jgi:hypothetical protein
MNFAGAAILALAGIAVAPAAGAQTCPPAAMSRDQLLQLKSSEFTVEDAERRHSLALDLVACLGSIDPTLRDGIAFEALAAWMRGKQLSPATVSAIRDQLLPQLAPDYPDASGVQRPFAILVLAEIARVDRVEQFMTAPQLQQLIDAGTGYLQSVRDYRGFDEREGWRHGVAHASDLMLQLAVNPRATKAQLDQLLGAIATQVAPPATHFYIYGEGDRLAQAVFYIASRKLHSPDDWRKWFERVAAPAPLASWRDAYTSQRGLAKRHNTMAFLSTLHLYVRESGAEFQALVLPSLVAAIKPLH